MDSEVGGDSRTESRVSCSCRSTCSTKRSSVTNRGCPCKAEGATCGEHCTCGSTAKPCKNKPGGSNSTPVIHPAAQQVRSSQPYSSATNKPSEEDERIKENNDVKEFIETLDEPMVRKLCIRSLRRGVGSMDYIHGLLIAEDDLDNDENDSTNLAPSATATELTPPAAASHVTGPSPAGSSLPSWCKCGVCTVMPQDIENKCCGQRRCVTLHTRFRKLCLDPDVLQLTIRNRGDIRNDQEDNSTRSFRKAGYRQFVLDRYGYLGKGKRKVCPSCVVKTIRSHYPSQTGVYMGFRHE